MRILVTGGTGLISTAIVQQLLDAGHEPVLFNRGITRNRLARDVETIRGDRKDFFAFGAVMKGREFDAVVDMLTFDAATAANAVDVFSGRIGQYVFCSTVCVYGRLTTIPATEGEPHKPTGEYGRKKSEAESVLMAAHWEGRFPVTIIRPAHTYGPGAPLGDIWGRNSALVSWLRSDKPIVVHGDGTTLWQPCYVDDVARAFISVLGRQHTMGQAYNAVGDEIVEWARYLERLAETLGRQARLVCLTTEQIMEAAPPEKTSGLREIFSIHNAFSNAKLKWDVPEFTDLIPLEEGVRRLVAWMDAAGAHANDETPEWLSRLLENASGFLRDLSR